MNYIKKHKKMVYIIFVPIFIILVLAVLSIRKIPEDIEYGVSFSKYHSDELGLSWLEAYNAILGDLGVRHLRLSAHWPMIEPSEGEYNWEELDVQMDLASDYDAEVILGVGKRLPGWPECHIPDWARGLSESDLENRITKYINEVVYRYKDHPSLVAWQVENEPFLLGFAKEHCGKLNKDFFDKEISLVKTIDGSHPILLTDAGETGTWFSSYKRGAWFGTTMYLYIWSNKLGPLRYPMTPHFFRIKQNIMELFYGKKPSFLIELGLEPWLLQPIVDTPIEVQYSRMSIDKFENIISFAEKSGYDKQYLWGAEWWYWMIKRGNSRYWDRARELFY